MDKLDKKVAHSDLHATLYVRWKQQAVDSSSWIHIVQDACHEYLRHLTPASKSKSTSSDRARLPTGKSTSAKEPSGNLSSWLEGLLLLDVDSLDRERHILYALQDLLRDKTCLVMKLADREFALAQLGRQGLQLIRFVLDQISELLFQTRSDPITLPLTGAKSRYKQEQVEALALYIQGQIETLRAKAQIDKWPLALYPIIFLIEQSNYCYMAESKVEMAVRTLALLLPLFPDTQNASVSSPVLNIAQELFHSVWGSKKRRGSFNKSPLSSFCCCLC